MARTQKRAPDHAPSRSNGHTHTDKQYRIGLVIDGSGGYEKSWEKMLAVQHRMFLAAAGIAPLQLRLLYNLDGEIIDLGWNDDMQTIAPPLVVTPEWMCKPLLIESLSAFVTGSPEQRADAVILIATRAQAENALIRFAGGTYRRMGTRLHCFMEGDDWDTTIRLAGLSTNGCGEYSCVDAERTLPDLCEGIALLTIGGEQALHRLKNEKLRDMLTRNSREKQYRDTRIGLNKRRPLPVR